MPLLSIVHKVPICLDKRHSPLNLSVAAECELDIDQNAAAIAAVITHLASAKKGGEGKPINFTINYSVGPCGEKEERKREISRPLKVRRGQQHTGVN